MSNLASIDLEPNLTKQHDNTPNNTQKKPDKENWFTWPIAICVIIILIILLFVLHFYTKKDDTKIIQMLNPPVQPPVNTNMQPKTSSDDLRKLLDESKKTVNSLAAEPSTNTTNNTAPVAPTTSTTSTTSKDSDEEMRRKFEASLEEA